MPQNIYEVTDPESGLKIRITGPAPPSEAVVRQMFAQAKQEQPESTAESTTPAEPSRTWTDTAADLAPSVGGLVGSLAAKVPLARTVAAGIGGAAGEGYGQLIRHATEIPGAVRDVARNLFSMDPAVVQATGEGASQGMREGAQSAATQGAIQAGAEYSGQKVGQALRAGGRLIRSGLPNPNTKVAAAVAENLAAGVPIDAGTATGNLAVKSGQALSDRTFGGSLVATSAAQRTADALKSRATQLADRVASTTTPEQAGLGVEQALEGRMGRLHGAANQAYDTVRTTAQQMPMTADVRAAKAALKPIVDQMERQMPLTQQQASPGLKALRNVVDGPDFPHLSTLDADLSAIKRIARGAESPYLRNTSQGMASKAISELEQAVADVVKGTPAEAALASGRMATKTKYAVADVLQDLKRGSSGEAVRMFGKMVAKGDANIEQVRAINAVAPYAMPKVGRALLDDMIEDATAKGGFNRGEGLFRRWDDLGAETKKILFRNPALRGELDRFFLVVSKLAENPNPSGTSLTLASLSASPLGLPVSYLMHNPTAVRLITQGLQTQPGPRLTSILTQLTKLAEQAPRAAVAAGQQD